MENKHEEHRHSTPSSTPVMGQPTDAFEMINKYGTYNIQPTADTRNPYPAIAQGLSERSEKSTEKDREAWLKSQGAALRHNRDKEQSYSRRNP